MAKKVYLGIDIGTGGLSVVACDQDLNVLATGEGSYDMVPDLGPGEFMQRPEDWVTALKSAMNEIHQNLNLKDESEFLVAAIGVSGQMHGEVLVGKDSSILAPARLWCDARNEDEEKELTEALGVKMPKRMTATRWLWTRRNQPEIAKDVHHITTPSGYLAYLLTGQWTLGVGDASGMFPIDIQTGDYDSQLLECYDSVQSGVQTPGIKTLLPSVKTAGQDAGNLTAEGASILGLKEGIPVAPAEGDQPAALAGSLISSPGMVSLSFGTSVCANSVGEKKFEGVSAAVDHFCAVDGRPINMIWLRNGTTFMNQTVEMLGSAAGWDQSESFQKLMPKALEAPVDCSGIVGIPFLEDEPGMGVSTGGKGGFVGMGSEPTGSGCLVRASILATIFNLRLGTEILDQQGFGRTRLILTGGLTRTPELAQIIADVFEAEVLIPESGDEGTAWGAAVMARFREEDAGGSKQTWEGFLNGLAKETGKSFQPNQVNKATYDAMIKNYVNEIAPYRN